MDYQTFRAVSALTFMSVMIVFAATIYLISPMQPAKATGCPTQFVTEHIDNALKAFDEKNAEELKNQLDLAKEALGMTAEEAE